MTDDEIRIAMAECLGWKWFRIPTKVADRAYRCLLNPKVLALLSGIPKGYTEADGTERLCNAEFIWREGCVPDLPSAAHEAEETLTDDEWPRYLNELSRMYDRLPDSEEDQGDWCRFLVSLTARQRAEAFLAVKGRRKE